MIGETTDYLRGYHAAMLEVAARCLSHTEEQQAAHAKARPTFFGRPGPDHYLALGASRLAKSVSTFAFEKGNEAFAARSTVKTGGKK